MSGVVVVQSAMLLLFPWSRRIEYDGHQLRIRYCTYPGWSVHRRDLPAVKSLRRGKTDVELYDARGSLLLRLTYVLEEDCNSDTLELARVLEID
jgi:hypothetical protein